MKKITGGTVAAMRKDRNNGMLVAEIAVKYGISETRASQYTKGPDIRRGSRARNALNPITPEELAEFRAGLHPGSRIDLPVMQYDDEGKQTGFKKEKCRIEHVSRHTVVFRRPNGRPEHRTIVELCQMGRSNA